MGSFFIFFGLIALASAIYYAADQLRAFSEHLPKAKGNLSWTELISELRLTRDWADQVLGKKAPELMRLADEDLIRPTQETIRLVSQTLDRTQTTLDSVERELKGLKPYADQVVPQLPGWFEELRAFQRDLPGYLDRVEDMLEDASEVSEETTEGVIRGLFKGVISAPIQLFEDLLGDEDGMRHLSTRDRRRMHRAADRILQRGELNEVRAWHNAEHTVAGQVKLLDILEDGRCRQIHVEVQKDGQTLLNKNMIVRKHPDRGWVSGEVLKKAS